MLKSKAPLLILLILCECAVGTQIQGQSYLDHEINNEGVEAFRKKLKNRKATIEPSPLINAMSKRIFTWDTALLVVHLDQVPAARSAFAAIRLLIKPTSPDTRTRLIRERRA